MTRQCIWDYYGNQGAMADDASTMLTESQVDEIVLRFKKNEELRLYGEKLR